MQSTLVTTCRAAVALHYRGFMQASGLAGPFADHQSVPGLTASNLALLRRWLPRTLSPAWASSLGDLTAWRHACLPGQNVFTHQF